MAQTPHKLPASDAAPAQLESGLFADLVLTSQMPIILSDRLSAADPIVFVNDAFLTLTGFTRESILGRPTNAVLGIVTSSAALPSIRTAMTAGRAGEWELDCRRTDESEFRAKLFLSQMRDRHGAVQQNFLSFIDLGGGAGWKSEQQQPYHALYEKAPGFIATSKGPQHIFKFANASYKKFVGRENLIGLPVADAMPEIVDQGIIAILDEVYRTGDPFVGRNMTLKVLKEDGHTLEPRRIDVVYQPVRNANGEITGLFCEGYDVSGREKANNALADLQSQLIHLSRVNAVGMIATTLAHELNQPLSAIANYISGVRVSVAETPELDRYQDAVAGIEDASQRATAIVQQLRDLTRRRKSAKVTFDLNSAVAECIKLVRVSTSPEIQYFDQVPSGTRMRADKVQIQQVIINFLLNASEAMQGLRRQDVTIRAWEKGDRLIVCVGDTGPGVSREAAETMFSWSESSKEDGMGLGLSICRTIVETHGGKIWLEQSGPEGSEYCFSVPALSASPPASGEKD